MPGQLEAAIDCPYCGERIVILVDPSVPRQAYVEDCAVCCQPMAIRAEVEEDGPVRVDARREDNG
jgi:DNA-directed RNA polymerase subunit RPC12/RpoP